MALVVYWPRRQGVPALPPPPLQVSVSPDASTVWQLRGFRADAATFCVVGFQSDSEGDVIGQFHWAAEAEVRGDAWSRQSDAPRELIIAAIHEAGAPIAALCASSATASKTVELRRRRCKIVFYDAELAAGGVFSLERQRVLTASSSRLLNASAPPSLAHSPFFHAPTLLDQVGQHHIQHARQLQSEQQHDTSNRQASVKGGAVAIAEAAAACATYVPFAVLTALAVGLNAVVVRLRAPLWMPLVGGKSIEDGSLFLALANRRLAGVATWPKRVRHYYRLSKSRPLTYQEKLEALQLVDFVLMVAIDVAVGYFLLSLALHWTWTQEKEHSAHAIMSAPVHFLRLLRANVTWLMGAPAGFKLNRPLATILGNGVLLWLDMWEFCFSSVLSLVVRPIGLEGAGPGGAATSPSGLLLLRVLRVVWHAMGVTLQLSLLADAVAVCTWSSRWVYQYFAKLNRLQRGLFSSLWRLFVGKKKNVLRQRVDSQEYDVSQLLLGTLMFTILVFIATTTMVFFVFFLLVRTGVLACLALLKAPVIAVHTLPVATLAVRMCRPQFFSTGMQLEPLLCGMGDGHAYAEIVEVTIPSVEVGASAADDRRHRRVIRDALSTLVDEDDGVETTVTTVASIIEVTECAYFRLKTIAASPGSLLTRLREYLAKHSASPQCKKDSEKSVDGNSSTSTSLSILCDLPPLYWPRIGKGEASGRVKQE